MRADTSQSDMAGIADRSPLALQRAVGRIKARFSSRDGMTAISDLHQSGSAKLRLPTRRDGIAEAILINTAGGLTGGDRFDVSLVAEEGAHVVATTQASERAYRSIGDPAHVETELEVGSGGRLDWLPQETILFNQARLKRRYSVDLHATATFLGVESVVLGRQAMGEIVHRGSYHDRWRIRRDGQLIHADDIRFDGDISSLAASAASLAGGIAMATIIYCGEVAERLVTALRDAVGEAGGASAFGGKLLARIVAEDSFALRQRLAPALSLLRDGAPLPKAWQL